MENLLSSLSIRKIWIFMSFFIALASINIPQPDIVEDLRQISTLIVTAFSFLAGFLIAAIAVVGYSAEVASKYGWQVVVNYKKDFKSHLERYAFHFILYLLSIILIVSWSYVPKPLPYWLWMLSLFFSTFSFLMAFSLPYEIISQHISMYDAIIEKAKKKSFEDDKMQYSSKE